MVSPVICFETFQQPNKAHATLSTNSINYDHRKPPQINLRPRPQLDTIIRPPNRIHTETSPRPLISPRRQALHHPPGSILAVPIRIHVQFRERVVVADAGGAPEDADRVEIGLEGQASFFVHVGPVAGVVGDGVAGALGGFELAYPAVVGVTFGEGFGGGFFEG